ncbi:hypothetical protein BUALT_Bualt09G0065700 [Buddleja alternifolia]|uniref:Uncharacterized protein n=1 Tax=Buddleja alternifolia TaxID=168488 RepID=A0AAV6X4V9_9LAMI|nr:hypothetical protein BUALT_Bualt09G0065700 [Buddleja alternifolia]
MKFLYGEEGECDAFVCEFEAIRKQPMTVYGVGKQARSFQYVSDLVVKETIDPSGTIEFKPNTAARY